MMITEGPSSKERAPTVTERRTAVVLVDDHPLFRRGLSAVLAAEADFELVGQGSGLDAIELANTRTLHLAILDLLLPGTTGAALTASLKRIQPACKILGLSMLEEPTRIAEMLRAGADGFALKSQSASEIIAAMRAVLAGESYLPPHVARDEIWRMATSDDAWPLRRLTPREREIFELLVGGRTNDEIASTLFIARRTVETHRQHIMKKLGVRSLVELVRIGMRHGLIHAHS